MDLSWYILDSYFKTSYFLTKHHLDSYNDFVSNKLQNTIKALNPFIVIKNQESLTHEINIYIGGKDGSSVYLSKPTIVDNDEQRIMYPNEARLKNLTYKTDLFADILVEYNIKEGNNNQKHTDTFEKIKIGSFPVMLHSHLCVLNNQSQEVLHEMGECIYDQGGYFVIDGKEKVIVAQERIATNKIFINKSKDPKFEYEGLIRCTSEETPLFPKTVNIYIHADSLKDDKKEKDNKEVPEEDKPKTKGANKAGAGIEAIDERHQNSIILSMPNISRPIPLFVLFRALGIESDKSILEHIIKDLDDPMNKQLLDFLRFSVIHGSSIKSQEEALEYLSNFVKYKSVDHVKQIIIDDIFPNVGIEFKNKALFLGHIIEKMVRVRLGALKESDRDNYVFKRVDISGFLMSNLFRDYYRQFRVKVRNTIDHIYLYGPWRNMKNIVGLVNNANIANIFKASIIEDGMKKSLKGNWGQNMIEEQQDMDDIKQGIVQDLSRFSYLGFLSHLRRVSTPMDPTSKIVAPHRLHTSQWGIMCPCESPDGGSIGLLKNLAIMCKITFDTSRNNILKCLNELNMVPLSNVNLGTIIGTTKVLINSNWVGIHRDPVQLYKTLKLLKRNALINVYTSISWNILQNELNIMTEAGRCCRPLLVVQNGKLIVHKYAKQIEKRELSWSKLVTGFRINNANELTDEYVSPFKMFPGSSIEDIHKKLEETQAPIEFIDVDEANVSYIAMYPWEVKEQHTHCEIHPSTILSVVTHQIPLLNFNQAPRNIFSGAQGKQAIGCYATNFPNRIDTMAYVLHYPQKPLLNTRYCDYLNLNKLPNGENLIVAIASYTGYNMEDAFIFNKNSIERGCFNITYYKNMVVKEEENKRDNETITFNNPKLILEEGKKLTELKWANYNKLDENGFPIINSYISDGDAIVGKTKIKIETSEEVDDTNLFAKKVQTENYLDRSIIADKTMSGTVDKVFVYVDDDNLKTAKIRFRKVRAPELGDKCCCYDEETEVLTDSGWKFFKDLTKNDKVASMINDTLVYQKPIELQCYDFDGKLYEVDSKQVNLRVTDNHRMYVRTTTKGSKYTINEAHEIYRKIRHYKKNVDKWVPDLSNAPPELLIDDGKVIGFMIDGYTETLQKNGYESTKYERVNDDLLLDIEPWLTFFGIWIAEGGITDISNGVRIAAHKPRVKKALDDVCPKLNFKIHKIKNSKDDEDGVLNSWRFYERALCKYMLPFSVGGNNKYLPDWVWYLNREQCKVLIHGMLLGDGDFGTVKQGRYYTTSTVLADQFQRLCLHAGFSANKLLKNEAGHEAPGINGGPPIVCNADYWVLSVIDKQNEPKVNKYMYNGKQKYDGQPNDHWVDYTGKVYCCTVPEGDGIIYVRRHGFVVWSLNSKSAQKGTCGMIVPQENMPFTKDGIIPDLIINPHAIPSRMTMAHLLEMLLGKISCLKGMITDGTPFENQDYTWLYDILEKEFNMNRHGDEIMYNGLTGDQIGTEIFMGPIFYERLKHMVADKINYRQVNVRTIQNKEKAHILKEAPVNILTRQPTKGRGNNGGLRIGEMERDSILSHGVVGFLKESTMERSDKYQFNIDNIKHGIMDSVSEDYSKVETPYAFKQLVHELNALSIKPNLYLEDIEENEEEGANIDDAYVDKDHVNEDNE